VQRLPTWPVAAISLIVGFAVADITGVRAIGGIVLVLAALWCGLRWRRDHDLRLALQLVAVYLVAFALSHVLGLVIGAWPAVFVVAAVVGVATWMRADRDGAAPPTVARTAPR
jgi:hypothetical protein